MQFVDALEKLIPNSEVRHRKGIDIKKIIPQAVERGFTNLVVINENHKEPSILFVSALVQIYCIVIKLYVHKIRLYRQYMYMKLK